MKGLDEQIEESKALANWIGDQVHDLSLKSDDRTRISGGLISLSMAHHASIVHLYMVRRYSSALALMRSMVDCFVRSQWVVHLAPDEQIRGFANGDDPPGTLKIIDQLEEGGFYDAGLLSGIVGTIWPIICDFNHGGGRMVVRHLTADAIEPNFEIAELQEVLTAANSWALIAACALADLIGDRKLGDNLIEHSKMLTAV